MSSTLTFAEGADGSQPSDAQCEGVAIIDDTLLEETESLVLKIAPVDENRLLVDESRSEKVLYILDDDGKFAHIFSLPSYQYAIHCIPLVLAGAYEPPEGQKEHLTMQYTTRSDANVVPRS